MVMKLLEAPKLNPINKDAVIDDLKRRLAATEYERERYKSLFEWEANRFCKYWHKVNQISGGRYLF